MTRSQMQLLIVSRNETARMLGVSNFTLWRWNRNGFLKPLIVDGQTAAYLREDIERVKATPFLERLKPGRRTGFRLKKKEASL
jgi:DNA-binding transcriptional MerR regulator